MIKQEFIMWKDIITCIKAGIEYMELGNWEVRQASQPIQASITKPTILLDIISSPRYGWQRKKDLVIGDELVHHEAFLQEVNFQITALKKKPSVSEDTAIDAINKLAAYFITDDAISLFRSYGYGVYKITNINTGVYTSDSDVYERCPTLDFTVVLEQSFDVPQNSVSGVLISAEGV